MVLSRALEGHPSVAVRFRYSSGHSHGVFTNGAIPAHAMSREIVLGNGWTVQSFAAGVSSGVFAQPHALMLLIGGVLLEPDARRCSCWCSPPGAGARCRWCTRRRASSPTRPCTIPLTGLPNRALVLDRAEQMLARSARQPGTVTGALFIDIDGFKHVNDNLGHAAGDRLLRVAGERLQSAVRDQDTVGRLGGDEFVVLVESTPDQVAPTCSPTA